MIDSKRMTEAKQLAWETNCHHAHGGITVGIRQLLEALTAERAHSAKVEARAELVRGQLRCRVTDNPCGTDTMPIGHECGCAPCRVWSLAAPTEES